MGKKDKTKLLGTEVNGTMNDESVPFVNAAESEINGVDNDAWLALADDDIEYGECTHLKHVSQGDVRKSLKKDRNNDGFPKCDICITESKFTKLDEDSTDFWICLRCGNVACGRYTNQHALQHHEATKHSTPHPLVYHVFNRKVWCYVCDAFVKNDQTPKLKELTKQSDSLLDAVLQMNKSKATTPVANGVIENQISGDASTSSSVIANGVLPQTRAASGGGKLSKKEKKAMNSINDNIASSSVCMQGLSNLGNTCFFNSVMQCLSHTHALSYLLERLPDVNSETKVLTPKDHTKYPPITVRLTDPHGALLCSLNGFLNAYHTKSSRGVINPGTLFSQISRKAPRFKGYQQQDSHELLRYLLDGLRFEETKRLRQAIEDCLEKQLKKMSDTERHDTIKAYERAGDLTFVDRIFGGKLLQSIWCSQCNRYSHTFEPFLDLSLSIADANTRQNGTAPRARVDADDSGAESGEDGLGCARGGGAVSKHQQKKQRKQTRKRNRRKSSSITTDTDTRASQNIDAAMANLSTDMESVTLDDEDMEHDGSSDEAEESDTDTETAEEPSSSDQAQSLLQRIQSNDSTAWRTQCNIGSCLQSFTAVDLLTGRNKFGCEMCYKDSHPGNQTKKTAHEPTSKLSKGSKSMPKVVYTDAEKSYSIFRPPAVLTIQLKRFQQTGFALRKWSKAVEFPLLFDLAPYTSRKAECVTPSQHRVLYSLYGVVSHSGSMRGGHYIAYVKVRERTDALTRQFIDNVFAPQHNDNGAKREDKVDINGNQAQTTNNITAMAPKGQWYYASDSHFHEVTQKQVLDSEAYLLFYERIQ